MAIVTQDRLDEIDDGRAIEQVFEHRAAEEHLMTNDGAWAASEVGFVEALNDFLTHHRDFLWREQPTQNHEAVALEVGDPLGQLNWRRRLAILRLLGRRPIDLSHCFCLLDLATFLPQTD